MLGNTTNMMLPGVAERVAIVEPMKEE